MENTTYTALDIMREIDAVVSIEAAEPENTEDVTLEAMKLADEQIRAEEAVNPDVVAEEVKAELQESIAPEIIELIEGKHDTQEVIEIDAEVAEEIKLAEDLSEHKEEFWAKMVKGYRGQNDAGQMRIMFEKLIELKPSEPKDVKSVMCEALGVTKVAPRFFKKGLTRMTECNLIKWDGQTKSPIEWV